MKTIRELEQKIEKAIIETLSSYRQIKDVLENTDYTDERKIKEALLIINRLKKMRMHEFKLTIEYAANDLVLDGEYELTSDLEELKLLILHKMMNSTTSSGLIRSDEYDLSNLFG